MFFKLEGAPSFTWIYMSGTEKNPGDPIAMSTRRFPTEAAARSDIARAKKAFAGARYAKVTTT